MFTIIIIIIIVIIIIVIIIDVKGSPEMCFEM